MSNVTRNQLSKILADQNLGITLHDDTLEFDFYEDEETGEVCMVHVCNWDAEFGLSKGDAEDYNVTLEDIVSALKANQQGELV